MGRFPVKTTRTKWLAGELQEAKMGAAKTGGEKETDAGDFSGQLEE